MCSALLVMAVRAATGTDDALLLNMTDNIRVSFTQHGLNEVVDLGTELVCVLRFSGVVVSSLCASLQSVNKPRHVADVSNSHVLVVKLARVTWWWWWAMVLAVLAGCAGTTR